MARSSEEVADLIAQLRKSLHRDQHHGKVKRYLEGDHDLPYIPRDARHEYTLMAKRSVMNLLPRVSDTFVKLLFVDGYRLNGSATGDSPLWKVWQKNKLNARQTIAHRGAIEYGASYVWVLKGEPEPVVSCLDPLKSMAWYIDDDDEYPEVAIRQRGQRLDDTIVWEVIDKKHLEVWVEDQDAGTLTMESRSEHGMGVCPVVRFRDRLDGPPRGIIEPLIVPQDRINDIIFTISMALFAAAFRQRWATGLAIPVDERETIPNPDFDPNKPEGEGNPTTIPNPYYGQPIETFDAAVDRLWVTDSEKAKFGDFEQTDVSGHLDVLNNAINGLAVLAQLPSGLLQGNLVNVAAEALASLYDVTERQAELFREIFGESWEQVFALIAIAKGQAPDEAASVKWRDTDVQSFAAVVDALGKMVQMLNVPDEGAWELIPGVDQNRIEVWRKLRTEAQKAAEDVMNLRDSAAPPSNADARGEEQQPAGDQPAPIN